MSYFRKPKGITLSKNCSRKFSSSIFALATFASLITFAATPAQADYYDAKLHFEALNADDQFKSILGLESTGDFNGLVSLGYTERLYKAILAFETKNNLEVDGMLQPWEISKLDSEGQALASQAGFTAYTNDKVGSVLWVPRNLFDSEIAIENGMSFQRVDKGYSLSFVAHTSDQSTFEELFDIIRTPSDVRTVEYQKMRDKFFVVTGENKGRKFYTYLQRISAGTTGFTLTYKAENFGLASKISTILANSFLAMPETAPPAAEPQLPQTVAVTTDETIIETPHIEPKPSTAEAPVETVASSIAAQAEKLAAPVVVAPKTVDGHCKITLSNYYSIHSGMSREQVARILGCYGTVISQSEMAGFYTVMVQWNGSGVSGLLGGNMNAMFQNDELISSAQFGLQ
jgi:hypothetical protein